MKKKNYNENSSKKNIDSNRKEMQEKCASIFKDTYEKCTNNSTLKKSIEESINNTKFYVEGFKFNISETPIKSKEYNIIITPDRTLDTIKKYYVKNDNKQKIGVLNFASAKHPGGGVLTGARSQEESICRSSTLYPCLITEFLNENYYSYHMFKKKNYSDRIIYVPNVIVFKTDDDIFCKIMDEKDWYNIDIISCAAHNQKAYKVDYEKLKKINYNKIKAIIECAVENNVDNLILGAFGCGAFSNPPKLVAKTFKEILINEGYYKYFDNVHFAIFTTQYESINLIEFQNAFEKCIKKMDK